MIKANSYNIFNVCNVLFFGLLAFVMFFPMYKVFVTSIITVREYYSSPLILWPRNPTIEAYQFIFSDWEILNAMWTTIFITVVGTFLSMAITLALAYAFSKSFLPGVKILHRILLITMFLESGVIPYYLLVRSLGLFNNIWVNIIPSLVSLWNYLVIRSFFKQLPQSLEEAALIDGAGWWTVFIKIIIPISAPVIATFTLYYAVGYWNSWYNALLFCNDRALQTMQLYLRRMIVTSQANNLLYERARTSDLVVYSESIKMACCIVATVPILIVYPFLQKHFAKGVMIGAIKG
jgi:putative aldouronate transport system permease protein